MKILWLTWKDLKNPLAGGAEVVGGTLAARLVSDGHHVTMVTAGFKDAVREEVVDGYTVIRVGSRYTVYWHAFLYYRKQPRGTFDLVIDEMNTIPFFARFYVHEPVILFVHQLAREIWFYEMRFPFTLVGYVLEYLYLCLLSGSKVITVSESTKQDLMRYGFKSNNISIISEGIEIEPVESLKTIEKYEHPTLLSLGSIRAMKRTDHIIKAFELAKVEIPDLRLVIGGSTNGDYGARIQKLIFNSPHAGSITYEGKVSRERKIELMQKAHILAVTSIKEGWCLVVTEAASQGTPAVVYNVDGLRDSVQDGVTGLITKENTPASLASSITSLLTNGTLYEHTQKNALEWSKEISFSNSYTDFARVLQTYF